MGSYLCEDCGIELTEENVYEGYDFQYNICEDCATIKSYYRNEDRINEEEKRIKVERVKEHKRLKAKTYRQTNKYYYNNVKRKLSKKLEKVEATLDFCLYATSNNIFTFYDETTLLSKKAHLLFDISILDKMLHLEKNKKDYTKTALFKEYKTIESVILLNYYNESPSYIAIFYMGFKQMYEKEVLLRENAHNEEVDSWMLSVKNKMGEIAQKTKGKDSLIIARMLYHEIQKGA